MEGEIRVPRNSKIPELTRKEIHWIENEIPH
jgi:hypothetical protein